MMRITAPVVLLMFAAAGFPTPGQGNTCVLSTHGCQYRVTVDDNNCLAGNLVQNDAGVESSMDHIERMLAQLREEHSRQLRTLESKLTMLLLNNGGPSAGGGGGGGAEAGGQLPFELRSGRQEDRLLMQLHKEFNVIREELNETRFKLEETERELSRTRKELRKTQKELERYKKTLANTEEKLKQSRLETKELKVELTQTNDVLVKTEIRAQKCDTDLSKLTKQLLGLRLEKGDLEGELEQCYSSLEQAKMALDRALIKYHELNLRHENTTELLNFTQIELIKCTQSKIMSFCGFEDPDMCGFRNGQENSELRWKLWAGATPSRYTGPSTDSTCGNDKGHYMVVGSAPGLKEAMKARLLSPMYRGEAEQCIEFHYHMYGHHTGILNVYLLVDTWTNEDLPPPVWRAYGNQGNLWTMAKLSVPGDVAQLGYQVVFEVYSEAGYAGDIALDDVRIIDEECPKVTSLQEIRARQKNRRLDILRNAMNRT